MRQVEDPTEGLWSTSVFARRIGRSHRMVLNYVRDGKVVPKLRLPGNGAMYFDPADPQVQALLPEEVKSS